MREFRARVLVIEDDPDIAAVEAQFLARAGYQTKLAATGADGIADVASFKPDVVLLDIGLPDMSGLDACTAIAEKADAYILFVSANSSEEVRLKGLGLGADDFINKPFSGNELVARIASFLRRRERSRLREHDGRLQLSDCVLVRDLHRVERDGHAVSLTALEFRLLWFLGEADGKLLTRAQILERVWNDVSGIPTRVVDVHVAALRKKLSEIGAAPNITSVRGIGYRLDHL
ncbi:MAG: response regulator transcription factor [Candidatus Eremiobacteraeota bacterium]|nr:response regulator transcription factor [Candidatus Eremiobacteraeota bacterium]